MIFFHAGFGAFRGGYVGVDIFFVISGYLITTIIHSDLEQRKFSIVNFYERRARRILPALFLVIFVCIPLAWILMLPRNMTGFFKSLIAVSSFSSNFLFWREEGYFNISADYKPLLHTWSLAVEEQFYLLFPVFLMLIWRLGRRWVLVLFSILGIVSLAAAQWGSIAEPRATFYLLHSRGWELLIGAFAAFYLCNPTRREFSRGVSEGGAATGLVLIFCSVFTYNIATPFPSFYTLIPTVGTALIILFSSAQSTVGRFIGNKMFVNIGLLSYSAYLWHQPLFAFTRIYTFNQISLSQSLGLIAATFLFSILSMRFIETPVRRGKTIGKRTIFIGSFIGMLFFSAVGLLGLQQGINKFPPEVSTLNKALDDWAYPGDLKKGTTEGMYVVDNAKPIETLFFGDSHAQQFAPIAKVIASASGKNVGFLTGGGCAPIPRFINDFRPHCFDLFDRFAKVLEDEKSIKKVIIAGCFNCYFIWDLQQEKTASKYSRFLDENDRELYFQQGAGINEALESLGMFVNKLAKSKQVVLIGDNPSSVNFDPAVMIAKNVVGESWYFQKKYADYHSGTFAPIDREVDLNAKLKKLINSTVQFVDSMEIVCPKNLCDASDASGIPKYKDSNHMRPHFVIKHFSEAILSPSS